MNGDENNGSQARSHQGTSVDISSDRDTFEYFLSTLGERELNDVQRDYEAFADSVSYGENQKSLFAKYQAYRQSLDNISPSDSLSGIDYLYFIQDQIHLRQAELFTESEQNKLFYVENLARDMTIKRLELEALGLDENARAEQWQDELDKLPPDMKESYQNAALISQIGALDNMSASDYDSALDQLVGTEAASRIRAYEQEEEAFEQNLAAYFAEKHAFSPTSSPSQLQALKDKYFSADQQRRVTALENVQNNTQ
ncbi:hypothetical protein ATN88_22155 [Enterovibrio coralii]|uniref:Lipase chaperone n=2 Tax=Enterovibrio coralii TaxID=294935 RepID=A0A135I4V7_9GAMM|nr:hypothetical protein ATN88_22155 [Enterovibrio coralii]